MPDQAHRLRSLVARTEKVPAAAERAPCLIAIIGGKGGVGTTTIAANLAIVLARDGQRTLLVDGDPGRADLANYCGLADGNCLADVLSGHRTLHESIRIGPGGTQVLTGRWASAGTYDWSTAAQQRLMRELHQLTPYTDCIVVDAGSGAADSVWPWWRAADLAVLVTTPDNVAVMSAYATAKLLAAFAPPRRLATIMNQTGDKVEAEEAQARLQRTVRRFLSIDACFLGSVPHDARVRQCEAVQQPIVLHQPQCAAAHELATLVGPLTRLLHTSHLCCTSAVDVANGGASSTSEWQTAARRAHEVTSVTASSSGKVPRFLQSRG